MTTRNQPTYDFLTGGPSSPQPPPSSFRQTLKSSTTVKPADPINEDLRIRIQTLEYELATLRDERALSLAQSQQDVSTAERQAGKEYDRAQSADAARRKAEGRAEALAKELSEIQTHSVNEKVELERRLRTQGDEARGLREEVEEAQSALAEVERSSEHRLRELEARYSTLEASSTQVKEDLEAKTNALQSERQKLSQKEVDVGRLEAELMAARASGGDSDTLGVLKQQLSEQVTHIRKLEMQSRDQNTELKAFRQQRKAVEVVEEEKRVLEGRVKMMDDLRKQLGEAELRKQVLEDERRAWTAYLERQSGEGEGEGMQFESPEDLAKAFMDARLENAELIEKLGAVEPELKVKDENIRTLEETRAALNSEIEKLKASAGTTTGIGAGDGKTKARLDRQRALAIKEVEYLRAQLKIFDAEKSEFQPEHFDEQKAKQIKELEDLVDEYRKELQNSQADLSAAEDRVKAPQTPTAGTKRKHDDEEDERLGEFKRKNRKLQDDFSKLQTRTTKLQSELQAKETQLEALKAPARTRILELRNNPTAKSEAVKMSTLQALKQENEGLQALLEEKTSAQPDAKHFVPKASLDVIQAELSELSASLAQEKKLGQRRKDLFAAKANEFRDAVMSLVGWKVNFLPNGRVKVASIFNNDKEREEMGEENSIVFDVEKETMKISGGPESEFAKEIRPQVEFWVEGRKEIPCFLAALNLEFFERSTRAAA